MADKAEEKKKAPAKPVAVVAQGKKPGAKKEGLDSRAPADKEKSFVAQMRAARSKK